MSIAKYTKRIFLAGSLKYLILCSLENEKHTSGYRILKNIKDMGIDVDAGSFYNSINVLADRNAVKKVPFGKKGTFKYEITEEGLEFLQHFRHFYKQVNIIMINPFKK